MARQKTTAPPVITSGDFRADFHARRCRAARYKAHAPLCSCAKVARIRAAVETARNGNSDGNSNSNSKSTNSGDNSSLIGKATNELSRLVIGEQESDVFDNLIVVPDTKSTPAVYVCRGTHLRAFEKEGTACEQKLANRIFEPDVAPSQETAAGEIHGHAHVPPFKVSCAICLLTAHQRNGFLAVVARSREEMQPTIQRARDATARKMRRGRERGAAAALHADHAHYVCALEVSTLQALLSAGQTRAKDKRVAAEIVAQMATGGGIEDVAAKEAAAAASVRVKLGHHLTSLLCLLSDQPDGKSGNESDVLCRLRYVMVIGYVHGPQSFELDLPGGKRHLGESALQCAVREAEEESSLLIDLAWLATRVATQYGGRREDERGGGGGDDGGDAGVFNGRAVRVLEPERMRGRESGDAFFVVPAPLLQALEKA